MRRAVRIKRRSLGAVRANSMAVLRPIPDEAPVIKIVLPSIRFEIAASDILRNWERNGCGRSCGGGRVGLLRNVERRRMSRWPGICIWFGCEEDVLYKCQKIEEKRRVGASQLGG